MVPGGVSAPSARRPSLVPKQAPHEPEGQPHDPVVGMGGHDGEDGEKRQDGVQHAVYSLTEWDQRSAAAIAPSGASNTARS